MTLHQTILGEIESRIVSGEWPPGHRLPFEVDLAKHYGCSRMTVNKVMTQLAKAGLIERHRRAGSFVTMPRAQSAALELHDIETEVKSLGVPYAYTLVSRKLRPSDAQDRAVMELEADTLVLELLAVHHAGAKPFCVEERRINVGVVPEAETADFAVNAPGGWLIAQVPWSAAENRIQALPASAEIARLLELPKGTPCLMVQRRTWNRAGPITFVRLVYPGDSHTLIARFEPAS
ncbi:histidine utilization repressor [Devosia faecipullorum]|uniref:histidine utilization repressor n=1 Tax=Devosia faecipullorum TaxID=2755039 RepID=UPI00187BC2FA|nr:histidine utilization repressor [Devosia faecipullorum]MBE7732831.1 histidine utilization repressor [Devosia faecipullorum]